MQMSDVAWLRERADRIAASGDPDSNAKAAALYAAADDLEAESSPVDTGAAP